MFARNQVDGKKLLNLTEAELKEFHYGITSLGRRKNIIRAINFLKASTCRAMNNGTSMLLPSPMSSNRNAIEPLEFNMNRSQGSVLALNNKSSNLA